MLNFPKKIIIGLEALLYIAHNSGAGPISSREIADVLGQQPRYLEQIMQKFVHAGLLKSIRGPKGGYIMISEKRKITLKMIYELLKEPQIEDDDNESEMLEKIIMPELEKLKAKFSEVMALVNLEDMAKKASELKISKKNIAVLHDFMI